MVVTQEATEQRTPVNAVETARRVALESPDRPAIISKQGNLTFGELDARTTQGARAMQRRGIEPGRSFALACSNRPEFAEALYSAIKLGLRVTPINWHLTAEEVAYIVNDCEAKVFFADARFAATCAEAAKDSPDATVRFTCAGDIDGFESWDEALAAESTEPLEGIKPGSTMLYTSGTTGRPKGVYRRSQSRRRSAVARAMDHRPGEDLHLTTGPLYHAAPLAFSLAGPITAGIGTVLMDGWNPEECLRLIDEHKVTHVHMVATMFHRLLSLPDDVRVRYDVSSLRRVVHGAAPTPVHVKKALIEWLGPIVWEYYAATEGPGATIGPEDWMRKPGSVGKPDVDDHVEIRDDDGNVLGPNEVGTVWLRSAENEEARFEYYKDPDKTSRAYTDSRDRFTLGDMGYLDSDGYLFLTDRTADLIISGGVNIYPAEVDAVLLTHPAVADACTIGVPNEEWGEEVKSVVELKDGNEPTPDLAQELIEHCRANTAHYKCPRSIDFTDRLPRHDTGKIYRRFVREQYRQEAEA